MLQDGIGMVFNIDSGLTIGGIDVTATPYPANRKCILCAFGEPEISK